MYMFVDQFNFHDSFTELGLTGRLALQKWDMSVSVVVVVTVLLILSDFCRLLSASNPVWLWDLFLYIRKKEKELYMYLKWKLYENSILFPGVWRIILLFSHFWECQHWILMMNLSFSDCNCECICCLNDGSFLFPCLCISCSSYTVRSCQCIWAF